MITQKLIRFGFLISVFLISNMAAADFNWQLKKEDKKNDIVIYLSEVEGSKLKAFKGVTHIKAPLANFISMLDQVEFHPKWMHNCIEAKTLQAINKMERVSYNVTKTPWPVKDREVVVYSKIEQNPDSLEVSINLEARPNEFPMENDNIRMPKLNGFWKFTPQADGIIEVTYQVHADPGGSLPAWLANAIVVDTPYNTLKNMRDQVNDAKYQNKEGEYPELKLPSSASN